MLGEDRKPRRAKAFYVTIALATSLGVLLNFSPIDPIKALFWSAVINGVVAVPVNFVASIPGTIHALVTGRLSDHWGRQKLNVAGMWICGVGVAMKPPSFLKAGDVVRIEIDKIGALEATMRPEA